MDQLSSGDKAAFLINLVAARCLDPKYCGTTDDRAFALVESADQAMRSIASRAKVDIVTDFEIPGFLTNAAARLESEFDVHEVKTSKRLLEESATKFGNGVGSGVACSGDNVAPCWGLMELARLVESDLRQTIAQNDVSIGMEPVISYTFAPKAVPQHSDHRVSGSVDITTDPRDVVIRIADTDVKCDDIIEVVYVLYHELVCHGFQAYLSVRPSENVSPKCHWSEGWMDTMAVDLAIAWLDVGAPLDWLPRQREAAKAVVRHYHESRYVLPNAPLVRSDMERRKSSREGYRRLSDLFLAFNLASNNDEAASFTRKFSWILNTHASATSTALRDLATRMSGVLESPVRLEDQISVAMSCLQFIENRDFNLLAKNIPVA